MKTVSCWKRNKLSYSLAPETIKKRLSQTSLPIIFDDVKSDKHLSKITWVVIENKYFIFSFNMFVYQKSASCFNYNPSGIWLVLFMYTKVVATVTLFGLDFTHAKIDCA